MLSEAKLARLKGKKCSSKDMIQSLSKAKQDHMEHIAPTTDYFSEETNTPSRLAQLQRRIVPQQALSADELQVLVENDELAKLMESISLEMEMEQLDVKKSAMGPDTKTAEASILSKETSPVKEDDDLANTNNTETACMDKSEPNDPVSPKEALQGEEKDVCEKNDTVTA